MNKLLIVNADDYGRTPEISKGILFAYRNGIVRSTTVMSNVVTDNEIDALKEVDLPAGLHFNLTFGIPISPWSDVFLTEEGCFIKRPPEDLPRDLIEEELNAQWDYMTARDITPTHIDSHHHIHAQSLVLSVVSAFALKRGVPVRPCDIVVALHLRKMGIKAPDGFTSDFYSSANLTIEYFLKILDSSVSESLEIMCHPGYSSDDLRRSSAYADEREAELKILTDERLKQAVLERGFHFGSYLDL